MTMFPQCRIRQALGPLCLPFALASLLAVPNAFAQEVDISYGASITSNYTSKGFTQTRNNPAIQGWAEIGYGPGYLSLFASNANFGEDDIELDIGLGLRSSVGVVDLDIGFVQYFYDKDDADYGEAYIFANAPLSDRSYIQLKYWYEVYAEYNTAYLGAGMELTNDFLLSGGIGSDFGTRDLGRNADYGDIGVSMPFAELYTFDLRGQFSRIEDTQLVGTLSVDF